MSGSGGKCVGCKVVKVLAGIGALNWGLVGLFREDLVARLFGLMTTAARTVYALIGVAGLLLLASLFNCCPCQRGGTCETKKA